MSTVRVTRCDGCPFIIQLRNAPGGHRWWGCSNPAAVGDDPSESFPTTGLGRDQDLGAPPHWCPLRQGPTTVELDTKEPSP